MFSPLAPRRVGKDRHILAGHREASKHGPALRHPGEGGLRAERWAKISRWESERPRENMPVLTQTSLEGVKPKWKVWPFPRKDKGVEMGTVLLYNHVTEAPGTSRPR